MSEVAATFDSDYQWEQCHACKAEKSRFMKCEMCNDLTCEGCIKPDTDGVPLCPTCMDECTPEAEPTNGVY